MYRITRTIFIYRDGSTKQSKKTIDVHDLEAYRSSIMRRKYAKINFVYTEIDDNGEDRNNTQIETSEIVAQHTGK